MKIEENEILYCSRGSSALYAILESIKSEFDTILLPVNICEIVIPVVQKSNYKILFYDVGAINGNAELSDISKLVAPNKCVVMVVHNFGIPVDIEAIIAWAKPKQHFIIEDICNSLGAKIGNRWVGTFGDASILSFGISKIISNGIGGGAYTKLSELKEKVKKRINGFPEYNEKYIHMDSDFQSRIRKIRETNPANSMALLNELYQQYVNKLIYKMPVNEREKVKKQFTQLDSNIRRREHFAKQYEAALNNRFLIKPLHVDGQVYWRYNLLVKENMKDCFRAYLKNNDVWSSSWYPPIAHMFFDEKEFHPTQFKGSYKFATQVVNLFVDSKISEERIIRSIQIINNFKF